MKKSFRVMLSKMAVRNFVINGLFDCPINTIRQIVNNWNPPLSIWINFGETFSLIINVLSGYSKTINIFDIENKSNSIGERHFNWYYHVFTKTCESTLRIIFCDGNKFCITRLGRKLYHYHQLLKCYPNHGQGWRKRGLMPSHSSLLRILFCLSPG